MGDVGNPWVELVAAAEETIRRIERGNRLSARDAIRTATVGLRGVLAGGTLDPEQTVCVTWLVGALDRPEIAKEFDANKALGLVTSHAPPVPEERDAVLCLWVHEELEHKSMKQPTAPVFKAVAGFPA